jgi:hypothetical protein
MKKAIYDIEPEKNRAATMIDSEHTLILFKAL